MNSYDNNIQKKQISDEIKNTKLITENPAVRNTYVAPDYDYDKYFNYPMTRDTYYFADWLLKKDLDIEYKDEDLVIAFNYKYVLDGLKNMEDEKVLIGLNTKASPTVFRPDSENDYISLVMPVQIR